MFRKRPPVGQRGPGLARTVARTAVISGTATAVSGSVANRQAQRHQTPAASPEASDQRGVSELQQQVDQLQAQSIQNQMQSGGAGVSGDDLISQITRLGELHQQGLLTAEEFEKAKARLLNG